MVSIEKDEIFKEMYMGIHWILLLGAGLNHLHLVEQRHPLMSLALMGYTAYLCYELWLYLHKRMTFIENLLGGYGRTMMDFGFLALVTYCYPVTAHILLMLMVILLLVITFQNSHTHALAHGVIGAVLFLVTAFHLTDGFQRMALTTAFMQSGILLFFSLLLAEVNHQFNGIYTRNHHAVAEIAYKNQLLERAAKTDFLTDMYNHQSFYQALDHVANHAAPISLILLDIDNFKRINDDFGHLSGDYVLREVAQLIKANIRSSDIAARYGGEEFAVLMPTSNQALGYQIAERIRLAIAKHQFILDETTIPVTISGGVGVSSIHLDKQAQSLFVDQVDTLLYEAKRSGKNKIIPQFKEGLDYESHYNESYALKTQSVL